MVYASTTKLVRENVDKNEKQVMIDYGLKVSKSRKHLCASTNVIKGRCDDLS